jgi:D-glycero-D-manno-heptose 1,7-bisphosphate phosphatase
VCSSDLTESAVYEIHQHIQYLLELEGAYLDGIYYCPHFPDGSVQEYRIQCRCRKPGTGMVEQASRDLGIETHGSYLIGDKLTDIETARRARLIGILVLTGYGSTEWERYLQDPKLPAPHHVCEHLYSAVDWILKQENI